MNNVGYLVERLHRHLLIKTVADLVSRVLKSDQKATTDVSPFVDEKSQHNSFEVQQKVCGDASSDVEMRDDERLLLGKNERTKFSYK